MIEVIDNWLYTTLSECAKWYSGGTPRTSIAKYWNGDIPWISASSLHDFYICDSERRVTPLGVENGTRLVPENTVLFVVRGMSLKTEFRVGISRCPVTFGQDCKALIAKPSIDSLFLAYFLRSQSPEILGLVDEASHGTGRLSTEVLQEIEVPLPPLPEQKAIAQVLSSLDDKIDLLHRQNKTLEAIAETLFRQWFIEEAQDDWEEVPITDLFEIRDGTHDSPKKKTVGKSLITSKHILDGCLDIGNAYLISDEDFSKVNQRSKVDTGDILFSMIGTIGLIYFEQSQNIDYAIKNIGLFKTSQNPDWAIYTYLWLKSSIGQQFIDEHKSGSTQEYVSLGSLRSITFQIARTDTLKDFNTLASEYFRKMSLNFTQIFTLEKLRNTLLPKLMSGEVRVDLK